MVGEKYLRSFLFLSLLIAPGSLAWAQGPHLIFPHFVNGEVNEFLNSARIVLRNNGDSIHQGRILFRNANGESIEVPVNGELVQEIPFNLNPWGTFSIQTDGTGPLRTGAVEVFSEEGNSSDLVGTEVFQLLGSFVSVSDSPPRSSQQVYVSINANENSGIAIYNPSPTDSASIEVILLGQDGIERARTPLIELSSREQLALFVNEERLFKDFFDSHPADFEGTLNIHVRQGASLAILGLLQRNSNGALITVAPSPKAFDSENPAQDGQAWAMAGANPQRTSWTPVEAGGDLRELWIKPIEPYISQKVQVILAEGKAFVSTASGLYAFDADTGAESWVFPTDLPVGHSPTYANGRLYFGTLGRTIYAVESSSGQKLWSFTADGGFQTNPLVVDQRVLAGSRDGNFYALHAASGQLLWKYKTDGQLLQSAAFQNGKIFFGSMDGHVYALDAGTGELIWKSELLPGMGWHSWWPIVYRDRLILTITNDLSGGPHNFENDWLFVQPGGNSPPGVWGFEPGDWVAGTPTIDVRNNPLGKTLPDYFEQHPERRNLFVLDLETGNEVVFDIDDDGIPDAAPVTRSQVRSGTAYPPVVGIDDVLYVRSISNASGAIAGGMLMGWKLGTPYFSLPISETVGQSGDWPIDEPTGFSSGGRYIYWNLCCDRFVGGADLTKPNTAFPNADLSRQWRYVSGTGQPPENSNSLPSGYHSQSVLYNWQPGNKVWYREHGDNAGPAIYDEKLFVIRSNALIAFSGDGAGSAAPVLSVASSQQTTSSADSDSLTAEFLQQRLAEEVEKMIAAGHLKPAFALSGIFDSSARLILGEYLLEYWHNPAELIYTLVRALPHLPAPLQSKTRDYLREEFEAFPPQELAHIGWEEGAPRQPFLLSEDANGRSGFTGPLGQTPFAGWGLPPHNLYAIWKFAAAGLGDASALYAQVKEKLPATVPVSDQYLQSFPHVLNAYIAGYIGYLNLEEMAGAAPSGERKNELDRLLDLRTESFTWDLVSDTGSGPADKYYYGLLTAWNFMFLVPELADHLHTQALAKVQVAVNKYEQLAPYWFVGHNEEAQGESTLTPIYQSHALFQAKALILKEPPEQLSKYLDTPIVQVGDLYFIDNVVSLLEGEQVF